MVAGDFEELLLAGYAPLRASGFALPCYAERQFANAWHVAGCSIEGDHVGAVTGFHLYDADGVERLPAQLHRRVVVGELWVDVFLWDGRPHVGTPAELLDELRPVLDDVAAAIPISLLDLTLAATDDDVGDLAEEASRHVERSHGTGAAARWRRDLWTAQARLVLRRQLASSGVPGQMAGLVRRAGVEETTGGLALVLPDPLSSVLARAGGLEPLRQAVRQLGERTRARSAGGTAGLAVISPARSYPQDIAPPSPDSAPESTHEEGKSARSEQGPAGRTLRILVVFSGTRARAIARHVKTPDWVPVDGGGAVAGDWVLRRGSEVRSELDASASVIDVLSDGEMPLSFGDYDVVAWLLDDAAVLAKERDSIVLRLQREGAGSRRVVHLLAPALPLHEPSRVLDELALSGSLPFGADAVVDTSIARSPFWTGNPWRAIDRRTADAVVGSALVCAIDDRVREAMLMASRRTRSGSRPDSGTRMLSLATDRVANGRSPEGVGFASETTIRRIARRPDRGEVYEFKIEPLRKAAARIRHGWVSLSPPEPKFGMFAEAAIGEARRSKFKTDRLSAGDSTDPVDLFDTQVPYRLERLDVPDKIAATLGYPQSSAAFALRPGRSAVVVAEAPTLKTLRNATRARVAVVRYTDRETLAEVFESGGAADQPLLPREIRLPPLQRLKGNKGLATRGVDPRDIVRLPRRSDDWGMSDLACSAVSEMMRGYIPRVGEPEAEEVALPLDAVADLIAGGGAAAEELREVLRLDRPRGSPYALKRPSDLRVAWAGPEPGNGRFVVEDGRFPIQLMRLSPGTVPAQRMFIVDGDGAVPLLLGSRLFAVWARATTSRSTSWLSRFSVGATFETMPIPLGLVVRWNDAGLASLVVHSRDSALFELAAWLGDERDGGTRWNERYDERDRLADASIWRDADAALLASVDLKPDATDVEVLERLVAINREGREQD